MLKTVIPSRINSSLSSSSMGDSSSFKPSVERRSFSLATYELRRYTTSTSLCNYPMQLFHQLSDQSSMFVLIIYKQTGSKNCSHTLRKITLHDTINWIGKHMRHKPCDECSFQCGSVKFLPKSFAKCINFGIIIPYDETSKHATIYTQQYQGIV